MGNYNRRMIEGRGTDRLEALEHLKRNFDLVLINKRETCDTRI